MRVPVVEVSGLGAAIFRRPAGPMEKDRSLCCVAQDGCTVSNWWAEETYLHPYNTPLGSALINHVGTFRR